MTALLKKLQNAANDFRPKTRPQVATVIQLTGKAKSWPWWSFSGLVLLLMFMVAFGAWLFEDEVTQNYTQNIIVPTPQKTTNLQKNKQKTKPIKIEEPQDIILPASNLEPEFDVAPAPNIDPAIDVISKKIADTPAALPSLNENPPKSTFESVPARSNESLLEDAYLLLESGDNQGALDLYDEVLVRDKYNRIALTGKVYVAQRAGQHEVAVGAARQLVRLDPRDTAARANFVTALGNSHLPSAMTELQNMVDARPNDASARAALAKLLLRRGYFEQAYQELGEAIRIEPDNLAHKLNLAILYDRAEQGARAAALSTSPSSLCARGKVFAIFYDFC